MCVCCGSARAEHTPRSQLHVQGSTRLSGRGVHACMHTYIHGGCGHHALGQKPAPSVSNLPRYHE
eukprot:15024-Eustigmatos_ZCMA.PRE.1